LIYGNLVQGNNAQNGFGQAYFNYLLKMILRKFISYFLSFILISMHFRNLSNSLLFLNRKEIGKEEKKRGIVHEPDLAQGLALPTWPNGQYWPKAPVRQCALSTVTMRACDLGGAVARSPPTRWWPADDAVSTESSGVEWRGARQGGGWRRFGGFGRGTMARCRFYYPGSFSKSLRNSMSKK
jgi:hypothetical protein